MARRSLDEEVELGEQPGRRERTDPSASGLG
jgi:hypothetical protein